MSGWGLTIPLTGLSLADHADLVRALPDLGYTDLWSSEVAGADAFTPLAVASQWAPQLRLGTAIVPVYTRGPALIAMSAATLAGAGARAVRARDRRVEPGDRPGLERHSLRRALSADPRRAAFRPDGARR